MRIRCFWTFITKYAKSKQEKVEETQFKQKLLGKFVSHETKKMNTLRL